MFGSILLAVILVGLAVNRIDLAQVANRDGLRLSTAAHTSRSDGGAPGGSDWNPRCGKPLGKPEALLDQQNLRKATYRVQVGIYETSVSELDLSIPSYSASGYIWLHWHEPLQQYLTANEATIEQRLNLVNALNSESPAKLQPVGKAKLLHDGSHDRFLTDRGRFLLDLASFRRHPFMKISLPLSLEVHDVDRDLACEQLGLIPNTRNSVMGLSTRMIGWLSQGWTNCEYEHRFATHFGLPGSDNNDSQILDEIAYGTSS